MNLPNKITVFRFFLIPVVIVISLIESLNVSFIDGFEKFTWGNLIILGLFILGAFSDYLDGHLARKHHLVTTFGKFMDPLADKMLVTTVLIILIAQNRIAPWIVIVILAREFMVMGIRTLAASENKIIAASYIAKVKTNFQFLMVIVLLLGGFPFNYLDTSLRLTSVLEFVLIYGAALLTVVSGADYFIKNRSIILESK
jgi:CDP-diacylglycerol--glycerol-3-phosphate 3-phosphatidyltransferase